MNNKLRWICYFIFIAGTGSHGSVGMAENLPVSPAVQLELEAGNVKNILDAGNEDQIWVLCLHAFQSGRADVLQTILDGAALPLDTLGSFLVEASQGQPISVIKVFLEHGVDPNFEATLIDGVTPLYMALTVHEDPEVMRLLLEYGADPLWVTSGPPYGTSSLFYIAYSSINFDNPRPIAVEKLRVLAAGGGRHLENEVNENDRLAIHRQVVIDLIGYFPE